jgi:hypothetical protein
MREVDLGRDEKRLRLAAFPSLVAAFLISTRQLDLVLLTLADSKEPQLRLTLAAFILRP